MAAQLGKPILEDASEAFEEIDVNSASKRLPRTSAFFDQTTTKERKLTNSNLESILESQWFYNTFGSVVDTSGNPSNIRSEDAAEIDKPRLGVPTLPEDQIDEPWYYTIEIGYAWLTGYRPDLYWSNTTECFDRMTNFTYHEKPELGDYLGDDDNSDYDKSEMTLLVVRNFSEHMWFCNSAW